jgi:hypothetical protein
LHGNFYPAGIRASNNRTVIVLYLNEKDIINWDFVEGGAILERQELALHKKRFGNIWDVLPQKVATSF